jgi:hypothetical protein
MRDLFKDLGSIVAHEPASALYERCHVFHSIVRCQLAQDYDDRVCRLRRASSPVVRPMVVVRAWSMGWMGVVMGHRRSFLIATLAG